MKGLLKNNIYATLSGAKILSIVMLLLGVFIAAVISQPLLIAYIVLGITAYSKIALRTMKDEFFSKWGKYKLTMPVRRAEIIKSQYLNQLVWTAAGTLFAVTVTTLSWLLHGSPFDLPLDVVIIFALGISVSLFTGALFFPLFYCLGEERGSILSDLSVCFAFALDYTIVSLINRFVEPGPKNCLLGITILLTASASAYSLSYPLTVRLFRHREY